MVTGVERNLFADIMTYVWDFWLYKGNSPHKDLSIYSNLTIPAGEHPSVAELVADFAKALEETGHHIYCDSFFSGLPTAEALSKAKQQFTMCCQANRQWARHPEKDILAVSWLDNNKVNILTNSVPKPKTIRCCDGLPYRDGLCR